MTLWKKKQCEKHSLMEKRCRDSRQISEKNLCSWIWWLEIVLVHAWRGKFPFRSYHREGPQVIFEMFYWD